MNRDRDRVQWEYMPSAILAGLAIGVPLGWIIRIIALGHP